MPASRIAFALADLRAEIERLQPRDAVIVIELRLNPDAYAGVVDELGHHLGQPLPRTPIDGGGEFVTIGAVKISTRLGAPDAGS